MTFSFHFLKLLQKKSVNNATKKGIYNKTLYVWINKFMPAQKIYTTTGCDG